MLGLSHYNSPRTFLPNYPNILIYLVPHLKRDTLYVLDVASYEKLKFSNLDIRDDDDDSHATEPQPKPVPKFSEALAAWETVQRYLTMHELSPTVQNSCNNVDNAMYELHTRESKPTKIVDFFTKAN
jgi:Centromere protein B dimerisation domain